MRPIIDWLQTIKDPLDRKEAIKHHQESPLERYSGQNAIASSGSDALLKAFDWIKTFEGYEYWRKIKNNSDSFDDSLLPKSGSSGKIPSSPYTSWIKYKDMIPGAIYYQETSSRDRFIVKHGESTESYIDVANDKFDTDETVKYTDSWKIRPASLDEAKWLEACIQAGKFVPKTNALLTIKKDKSYVKSKKHGEDASIEEGRIISSKPVSRVSRGKRPEGDIVRGRASKTAIASRHLSNGASIVTS